MHLKYAHYFGNESSESIFQELPKDNQETEILRPRQCPNCNEPNRQIEKPSNGFTSQETTSKDTRPQAKPIQIKAGLTN